MKLESKPSITESDNEKITVEFGENNACLSKNKIFPNNEIRTT